MTSYNPEVAPIVDELASRELFLVRESNYTLDELLTAAQNFARIDKHPTAEAMTLREKLVRALHAGGGSSEAFRAGTIRSGATARLIEICLDQELRLGLEIQKLDDLRRENPAAFIGRLTVNLLVEERQFFDQAVNTLGATRQELLLRRLSGEGGLTRPGEKGLSIGRIRGMQARLRQLGYSYSRVAQNITPFFPPQRDSIFEEFEHYLPVLDYECGLLARRLQPKGSEAGYGSDFDRIALSLFDANLSARGAATVLNELNLPSSSFYSSRRYDKQAIGGMPNRNKKSLDRYKKSFNHIFQAYRIRLYRPPGRPAAYEESAEAESLIFQAMGSALENMPPVLRAEQEVELAQDIEMGMWAEIRLALRDPKQAALVLAHLKYYGCDPLFNHLPATDAELQAIASRGREAYVHFLCSNFRLARWQSERVNKAYQYTLEAPDAQLAGMKGVVRAIRKFDYMQGFKFSVYAINWINLFTARAVFKKLNLPDQVGNDWAVIKASQSRLAQALSREPSHEEVAADTGLTPARVLTVLEMADSALVQIEHHSNIAAHQRPTPEITGQSFSDESRKLLGEIFADEPALTRVIELHFQDGLSEPEIADVLSISPQEASARLAKALGILACQLDSGQAHLVVPLTD